MTKIEESLVQAEQQIKGYFEGAPKHVYVGPDLYSVFGKQRESWQIVKWAGPGAFVEFLTKTGILREVKLESEHYAPKKRLVTTAATEFEIAMSLAKGAYLTHGTAIFLHGLNDQIPKTLYANKEQSPKPAPSADLTQERIDLAFSRSQRSSKYVFKYNGHRLVLLSGKHTKQFGVVEIQGPSGEQLKTTSIARTLVDIAVRPGYSGGVVQVIAAYKGARSKVSGTEILKALRVLDYMYPYHQSIGFLLDRAGFDKAETEPFREIRQDFNFHLVHGIREKSFDEKWRLFYPKGL